MDEVLLTSMFPLCLDAFQKLKEYMGYTAVASNKFLQLINDLCEIRSDLSVFKPEFDDVGVFMLQHFHKLVR